MSLKQSIINLIDTKVQEIQNRQQPPAAAAQAPASGAGPAPAYNYPPAANNKKTLGSIGVVLIMVVVAISMAVPSCDKKTKQDDPNLPEPATLATGNPHGVPANHEYSADDQRMNQALQKLPPQPTDVPKCEPSSALRQVSVPSRGEPYTCVYASSQNRWLWMPSRLLPPGTTNPYGTASLPGDNNTHPGNGSYPGNHTGNGGATVTRQLSPLEQFRQQAALDYWKSVYQNPMAIQGYSNKETGPNGARPETSDVTLLSAGSPESTHAETERDGSTGRTPHERESARREEPKEHDPLQHDQFPYNQAVGPFHTIRKDQWLYAILDSAIDGASPGQIEAHLAEPLYLENTDILLAPAGTVLIGDSQSLNQQQRTIGFVVDRMNFRDGYSLSFEKPLQTGGPDGAPGIPGELDRHILNKVLTASVAGILGAASSTGIYTSGSGYSGSAQVWTGASREAGQEGSQILQQSLNQPNTFRKKPGGRIIIKFREDVPNVPEFANHHMVPGTY